MCSEYFPAYSTARNKIVSVKLYLKGYVTEEEFKNLTKVDTSDFALKTNVAEIKKKADDVDLGKINIIDEHQGKNIVENSYLYFRQKYKYFEIDKANPRKPLPWKSTGISNEKIEPPETKNALKVLFEEIWPYLKIDSFKSLAQAKVTYTHESIVNIYIVYLMPDITDTKRSDLMRYGLFGATAYNTDKKLVGYGVGFGTQNYRHYDSKEARNSVIVGPNSFDSSNALVLGMGNIKRKTNDKLLFKQKIN